MEQEELEEEGDRGKVVFTKEESPNHEEQVSNRNEACR